MNESGRVRINTGFNLSFEFIKFITMFDLLKYLYKHKTPLTPFKYKAQLRNVFAWMYFIDQVLKLFEIMKADINWIIILILTI